MNKLLLKKTLALGLTVLIAFGCACTSKQVTKLENPLDMYAYVLELGKFPQMSEIDSEKLDEVYGIESSKLQDYVLYQSADQQLADEIGIFRLSDPNYEQQLIRILKAHIGSFARQAEGYNKEQYQIIKETEVFSKNGYVFFIINSDGAELSEKLLNRIAEPQN